MIRALNTEGDNNHARKEAAPFTKIYLHTTKRDSPLEQTIPLIYLHDSIYLFLG